MSRRSPRRCCGSPYLPEARASPIAISSRPTGRPSAAATVQHFQKLVDLGLPVAFAASMKGMRHAMLQVVAQRLLLDLVERRAHGADLGQHVDAVTLLLDHARHAAHLAFDAAKPRKL